DVPGGLAFTGQAQHLAFAVVQRIGLRPGFQRQLRIDRPATALHGAQRLGEVLGGRVLVQVAGHARIQRTAQEAGSREGGDDDHLDRQLVALDALRQLQPGEAGHLDVGDQYVGLQPLQLAPCHLAVAGQAQHLDVGFEVEQRRQRTAHHRLVLGQQHADHAALSWSASAGIGRAFAAAGFDAVHRGTSTSSVVPRRAGEAMESVPPSARTRSRMPLMPLPWAARPPRPLSLMRMWNLSASRENTTRAVVACAWRWMLVTASRSTSASDASISGGSSSETGTSASSAIFEASSISRADDSSAARSLRRMPVTAARTSASAWRETRSTSSISRCARGGSASASLRANSDFSVTSDSVWP